MISIIICSRTQVISPIFSQNIAETIGSAYELIVIDNSKNTFSIFEAYNIGIKKSTGNYWCFMHDDILFHTQNWGKEIINIFEEDEKIGLIGVAGTKIKTKMPSAWFDCPESQKLIYLIQHYDKDQIKKRETGWQIEQHDEVVIIDGVFMVGKTDENINFDERLIGFHNYDLNLSLAYRNANYKVIVTRNVLLEHFSQGKIDESWYYSTLKFDSIYRKYLPLKVSIMGDVIELERLEFKNGKQFCIDLLHYNLPHRSIKYWIKLFLLKPFSKFHLRFLMLLFRYLQSIIYRYYQLIFFRNSLASKK